MIGYHVSNKGIANSKGETIAYDPNIDGTFLTWLVSQYPGQGKMLYDIDAAMASLARLIPLTAEEIEKLITTKRVTLDKVWQIHYYPDRLLVIKRGFAESDPVARYTNAGQYIDTHFTEDDSLQDAIQKAQQAEKTGLQVESALKNIGIQETDVISPINAYLKRYFACKSCGSLERMSGVANGIRSVACVNCSKITKEDLYIPTYRNIPDEAVGVLDWAMSTVKGNWLECWARGYWEHAYDYDISGAYASQLARLLDLRRGRWVYSLEIPAEARYGWARGLLTMTADFHPLLWRPAQQNPEPVQFTYTPIGTREDTLTLQQIRFIEEFNLGSFRIIGGWWWIPTAQPYEILKGTINWLWGKRNDFKAAGNDIGNEIVKRILAGIWGKMSEAHGDKDDKKPGPFYNPLYASIVESNTYLTVARAALENGITPLHVAVDGMITDQPLTKVSLGRELGQWRLSHEGGCIIVSCGIVGFEGKAGAEEFSLRYDWLKNELETRPRRKEYKMTKWSPCTIARAGKDMDRLGKIEEVTRTISIAEDYKRMWRAKPKNGGDLLKRKFESAPWDVSMLQGAQIEGIGKIGKGG